MDCPEGMRFCGHCGKPLALAPDATGTERRVLTVLFCDLVGSTALAERLDPEDLRGILGAYQETCRGVLETYGGHVAQYLGDGLLVYFGYPRAREDDARRAVRSALRIVLEMADLSSRLAAVVGKPLAVRLGIHTGPVVVGEVGMGAQRGQLALGSAPNLAARLQTLAQPGTVLVSETTRRLVQGFFLCRSEGTHELAGSSRPLAVYQVVREGDLAGGPPEATRGTAREAELAQLVASWRQACQGHGQVVLVGGEAGIGKSRLVRDFLRALPEVAPEIPLCLAGHGSPYYQDTAYHPLIDLLERHFALDRSAIPAIPATPEDTRLQRLEAGLRGLGLALQEHLPLWAGLLSIPLDERYPRAPRVELAPRQRRQGLLDSLVKGLLGLATPGPLLLVFQDLHWVDPSTVELLGHLLARCSGAKLLLLLTFRPTFKPPWPAAPHLSRLDLARLDPAQVAGVIAGVAGERTLPPEVLAQLVARAEGVPLFAEELTKMVLEAELTTALPTTLQSSLEARLDRLGPAKEVAQLASILGREVDLHLLAGLARLPAEQLAEPLGRLAQAELLFKTGETSYIFKHALIQEAAYASLLKETRRRHHRSVARLIEERFPEIAATRPELLAHHCSEGELAEKAVAYWQRAGQTAVERSADLEATRHLERGLALLDRLPAGEARDRLELELQAALGPALMATRGFAAPEVEKAYRRAHQLCERLAPTPHLFPVLWGLVRFHNVRAELDTSQRLGRELLAMAEAEGDVGHRRVANLGLGVTLFHCGELAAARRHLESALDLAGAGGAIPQAFLYGVHPAVHVRSYTGYVLWHLGLPDQALERSREGLALARELSDPLSLALALNGVAIVHQFRREGEKTQELAAAAVELAREGGFPLALAMARTLHGWALAEQDRTPNAAAVGQVRQALLDWVATGSGVAQTHFLALLAELYGRLGEPEEGLRVLSQALAIGRENGERYYEAEIHRLSGELRLATGAPVATAEGCFERACRVAHDQEARSLELRATLSLAHLLRASGRAAEGHRRLAPLVATLPEGAATADLAAARDLLARPVI